MVIGILSSPASCKFAVSWTNPPELKRIRNIQIPETLPEPGDKREKPVFRPFSAQIRVSNQKRSVIAQDKRKLVKVCYLYLPHVPG